MPVVVNSLLITAVWYTIGGFGAQLISRSMYSASTTLDPFSLQGNIITAWSYLLNVLPAVTVYMWFSGPARNLEKLLMQNSISDLRAPMVIRRKWDFVLSIGIVLLLLVPFSWGLKSDQIDEWWETWGFVGWAIMELNTFLFGVVLFLTLLSVLHFWIWLNQELERGIKIRPLSPDGVGGVGFIGGIITRLTIFAIVMGFSIGGLILTSIYINNPGSSPQQLPIGTIGHAVIMVLLYVCLISGLLLIPTMLVRKVMVRQRDAQLQPLVDRFNVLIEVREQDNQERLVEMQSIVSEYQLVRQNFPTLPFSIPNLRGLQALALIPPAVTLISVLLQ